MSNSRGALWSREFRRITPVAGRTRPSDRVKRDENSTVTTVGNRGTPQSLAQRANIRVELNG